MTISCGDDRTWQYEEMTQHNHWLFAEMKDKYLWGDSLKEFEPAWKDYFNQPSEFLSKLAAKSKQGDSWSYVEVDTLNEDRHKRGNFNHVNSYGMDFVLMNPPYVRIHNLSSKPARTLRSSSTPCSQRQWK